MTKHGTISKYTGGCRCKRCRGANAEYHRAYKARRKATQPQSVSFTVTDAPIVADSTIVLTSVTAGSWSVDVRSPMERLVDACVDLREAFADYYAAREEPVT